MAQNNLEAAINDTRTLNENFTVISNYIMRNSENVLIHLYTEDTGTTVDWTEYNIVIHDLGSGDYTQESINAEGECTFSVPLGHIYEVAYPTIGGLITPTTQTYSAASVSKVITTTYGTQTNMEILRILVVNGMTGAVNNCLDGETITVYCTDSSTYSGVTSGASCEIQIPYGKTYTLTPGPVEGYRADSGAVTYTACQVLRSTYLKYTEVQYGMFGVDDAGNMYTIAQMTDLADKTIIKYGYYNDEQLNNSIRVNAVGGVRGNGFYWKIGEESLGKKAWAAGNVRFDVTRLPMYSNLGDWKYAGRYATDTIISIGLDLFPDSPDPTPAAAACANKSITIGNTPHRGILLTYDQIHKLGTDNRTNWNNFYAALGRTSPINWASSRWWTSCQSGDTYAVSLRNGNFDDGGKTNSFDVQVFCGYDI